MSGPSKSSETSETGIEAAPVGLVRCMVRLAETTGNTLPWANLVDACEGAADSESLRWAVEDLVQAGEIEVTPKGLRTRLDEPEPKAAPEQDKILYDMIRERDFYRSRCAAAVVKIERQASRLYNFESQVTALVVSTETWNSVKTLLLQEPPMPPVPGKEEA